MKNMQEQIRNFRLPHYEEITDVGLYLDQTARYLNSYLSGLGTDTEITTSMISNYVKKRLLKNPQHKLYSREQIALLFFIALAKPIMSLEHVHTIARTYCESSNVMSFYESFRGELFRTLFEVFSIPADEDSSEETFSPDQVLIRSVVTAIAHTIYMNLCFQYLASSEESP